MIFLIKKKTFLNIWIDCDHTTTIRYDLEEHNRQIENIAIINHNMIFGHTTFYSENQI